MESSLFGLLRPQCVKISQLLAKPSLRPSENHELELALKALEAVLLEVDTISDPLFDYVLFPILQLFQPRAQARPTAVSTTALRCLCQILRTGQFKLSHPEFAVQILILLANLFEKQGALVSQRKANELEITSLCACLQQLCYSGRLTYPSRKGPNPDSQAVIFGTLLAVIFEFTSSDDVSGARLSALQALKALVSCERAPLTLRRYLPGLLSNLVKPFMNLNGTRWSFKAIVTSIEIIRDVVVRVTRPGELPAQVPDDSIQAPGQWLRENSINLLAAFKHILKAQNHEREEVHKAVRELCIDVLETCHSHFSTEMTRLLLTCAVKLQAGRSVHSDHDRLLSVLDRYEDLTQEFHHVCNRSINQLPTELQSRDPGRHSAALTTVTGAIALAIELEPISQELSPALVESLLATSTLLMKQTTRPIETQIENSVALLADDQSHDAGTDLSVIFGTGLQTRADVAALQNFIQVCRRSPMGVDMLKAIATSAAPSVGTRSSSLSQLWLLATFLGPEKNLIEEDSDWEIQLKRALELAYNASLDILRSAPLDPESDWRAQVLALNFVGRRAAEEQVAFRPELVYALYPIMERIACENSILQRQAVNTLGVISRSSGYKSPGDLLLQNADYLINAVGIRLNTFDVRPEAATVLQVALKLCGPLFLPYVGDLAESIFTILDLYHGYPSLVQSMFSVLGTIVDQAAAKKMMNRMLRMTSRGRLTESDFLARIANVVPLQDIESSGWTGEYTSQSSNKPIPSEGPKASSSDEVAVSAPTTTSVPLVARVLRQAQFYLTYDAVNVRHGIIRIVDQGFRALQHDEDNLLPVINDLWPVLVLRLYDSEAYVAIETLAVLSTILTCAGDFLSSRMEDEWPRLRLFLMQQKRNLKEAAPELAAGKSMVRRQSTGVWRASMDFTETLVHAVQIAPEMEDDILDIYGGDVQLTSGLATCLDAMNGDALWLSRRLDTSRLQPVACGAEMFSHVLR